MVVSIIIGILILAVIVFTIVRIVKNIIVGLILVGFLLLISYVFLGSFPNLREIPIIGPKLPRIPSIGEFIGFLRKAYQIKIIKVFRGSENQIMITIKNVGNFAVSNFSLLVDNKPVNIINRIKSSLKPGEMGTIETNWKEDFNNITIIASEINVTYSKTVS